MSSTTAAAHSRKQRRSPPKSISRDRRLFARQAGSDGRRTAIIAMRFEVDPAQHTSLLKKNRGCFSDGGPAEQLGA